MKHTAIVLALGFLGACTTIVDGEGGDDFADEVRADSAEVWVTIGSDAIDVIQEALLQGELDGEIEALDRTDEATVIRMSESQVPQLTRLMHEHLHRCGGYVVHNSFKRAVESLDNPKARVAREKVFVNYTIDNAAVVNTLLGGLEETQIRSTITSLSTNYINRYYTTQSGVDSAVWIRDQWLAMANGRSDVTVELYQHSGYPQPSVIMTITGDTYPSEVVVLGAHLDSTAGWSPGPSTSAPGADDDASGIATISEVARVALSSGFKPDRTVKIIGYAAEEVGLRGSGDIAGEFASQGVNVIGVLQLDMTNYNGSTQDIVLISDNTNAAQNQFVGDLVDAYLGLSWTYTQCGYACSDHASWHSNGYPASFPFEALFNDYNPYIHTGSDTLANSGGDAQHALKFAKVATAYMVELAKGALDGDTGGGGDPPPPPPPPTTETFSGSVSQGQNVHYGPFTVEPGTAFSAQITGTGDADLYVNFGSAPTTSSYDCRPYISGSSESCNLTVPSGVTEAYVMIRGYTSATYTLTVTYTSGSGGGNPPPGPTTETFSDSVSQGQNKHYGPFSVVPSSTFSAGITGNGDADLYVRFGAQPTTSSYDCRPYRNGSSESCNLTVPSGQSQAYVMIRGYQAATYTLTVTYTSP